MKDKKLEMIVLLNGNFVPFLIDASDKEKYTKIIETAITAGRGDPGFYIKLNEYVTIMTNYVVGWYFREPVQSPADKVMNFLKKEVNNGEDWKSEE